MATNAPPGLGMPPGLALQSQQSHSYQSNDQQQQQQPPFTAPGQLAQLLAGVGGNGSGLDMNGFSAPAAPGVLPSFRNGSGFVGFASHPMQMRSGGGGGGGTSQYPCRMHQQGYCKYGLTCKFAHVGPAGSGGGAGMNGFGQHQHQQQHQQMNAGGAFGQQNFGGNNNPYLNGMQQQQQQQHPQQQSQFADSQPAPSSTQSVGASSSESSDALSGGSNESGNNAASTVNTDSATSSNPLIGGTATNSNQMLQALLMQQQPGGSANPAELQGLLASLNRPQQAMQQMTPEQQKLNAEFMQAQAQLASLALGGANQRPPQHQHSYGHNNFRNQNQYGVGNSSSGHFGPPGHKPHHAAGYMGGHHNHHGVSAFHAGGNFNNAINPALLAAAPQMHFRSDPNARDPRRELELFGPTHTMPTGINFDSYDAIPVEVTGNDCPGAMTAFSDFDFPDVIKQNITLSKYVKPTPIQKYALPIAFLGRDIMACAQTGSGKTAAFLLPFISHLVINGRPQPMGGHGRNRKYMPVGLILAPTRELATQIWQESLKFTYLTTIHSVVVYGGQDIRHQFRELDRGCDLLVGTPGRLMDFVERGRISLAQVSCLVLDEADRMLDMGFEPQIRNIVMQQDMTENRQTMMFSATFPKEIQRLAADFLYNYIFIAVGRVGASSDFITQNVEWVPEEDKRTKLMQLLPACKGLTLIFVERKKSADLLETYLNREGFHASSIHGDRSQHEREQALAMFRNGRCPILVATDVAARGLDIANVNDVINFDFSNTIDDYVHRIGRTGRAGNTGNAWSFINEKSSHLYKELFEMLHENKQAVPQWLQSLVESTGRGPQRGGGGNRRFGGRDMRKGGFGAHSGGRGGMAHHQATMAKRFNAASHHQHHGAHHHHSHQHQQQQQQFGMPNSLFGSLSGGNSGGGMFPSAASGHAHGHAHGHAAFNPASLAMRNNPAAVAPTTAAAGPQSFNLAAAMTGRAFPQQ